MDVVGERVAVGDFHFLAGAEGQDVRGVLAALLVEKNGSRGNGAWIGGALGNVNHDVADGIPETEEERFGKERIGGAHLRAGGLFRKIKRLGFGRGAIEYDLPAEFRASRRGEEREGRAQEKGQRERDMR